MESGGGGSGAPTGCYKCGRPGHWSRDCPSNPGNPKSTSNLANSDSNSNSTTFSNYPTSISAPFKTPGGGAPAAKPRKAPRSRPKLTPELLLSNDGIGYILAHFPRAFKYRGRGHEVSDLGNLIGLYAEWHSHLLPYYSFDQFVHKVEQVGATRHVKTCLGGLREKVANGGDPTKLHESPSEHATNNDQEDMQTEELQVQEDASVNRHVTDNLQEDMIEEIYKQATEDPSPALHSDATAMPNDTSQDYSSNHLASQVNDAPDDAKVSGEIQISEEQKARMEANRLKALERAAARTRLS